MKRHLKLLIVFLTFVAVGCATTKRGEDVVTEGLASWYGQEFAGRTTANGEIFDPGQLTAAHRTLPFGTLVRVTNSRTGADVVVRINDRGPFIQSRIIDLSYAAAAQIGMVEIGVTPVRIEVVRMADRDEPPAPYVVRVEEPEEKIEVARIPEKPPEVAFPLPDSAGNREVPAVEVDEVEVEIIEDDQPAVKSVDESGERIVTAPTESPRPVNRPAASMDGFVVQLGAFGVEENAHRLADEVRKVDARVVVRAIGGLWRVRVGPVADRIAAIELRDKLEIAGYPGLIVDTTR